MVGHRVCMHSGQRSFSHVSRHTHQAHSRTHVHAVSQEVSPCGVDATCVHICTGCGRGGERMCGYSVQPLPQLANPWIPPLPDCMMRVGLGWSDPRTCGAAGRVRETHSRSRRSCDGEDRNTAATQRRTTQYSCPYIPHFHAECSSADSVKLHNVSVLIINAVTASLP